MYRRRVMFAATAVFAIGVAFAAQPTSTRGDRAIGDPQSSPPWAPGTSALMSVYESRFAPLAPPR